MAQDGEDFLRRWSRRKLEQTARAAEPPAPAGGSGTAAPAAAPDLPPLDAVNFDSDFRAFMHAKVDEGVRRAALKKLFSDPRFNVMDGLDVYIDDYTKGEAVTEEMLATLQHARTTLFGPKQEEEPGQEPAQTPAPANAGAAQPAALDGQPAAPDAQAEAPAAQAKTGPDGAAG